MLSVRPHDTMLGRTKGKGIKGFHSIQDHPDAETYPGLLIYRFESDLLFYNIDYFKQRLLKAIAEAEEPVEWVVIDASPINIIDLTAVQKIDELHEELAAQGIVLARARAKRSRARFFSGDWGKERDEAQSHIDFPTLGSALKAFEKRDKRSSPPKSESEPEPESEAAPEPESEPESEIGSDAEDEPEGDGEDESESELESESESDTEPETEPPPSKS